MESIFALIIIVWFVWSMVLSWKLADAKNGIRECRTTVEFLQESNWRLTNENERLVAMIGRVDGKNKT